MGPMSDTSHHWLYSQQLSDDVNTHSLDISATPGSFSGTLVGPMEQDVLAYGFSEPDLTSHPWAGFQEPYGLNSNISEAQPPGFTGPWQSPDVLTPYLCGPSTQISQEPIQLVSPASNNSEVSQHQAPTSKQPGQVLRWKPPSTSCSPASKISGTSRAPGQPSPEGATGLTAAEEQEQLEQARAHRRKIKSQSRLKTKRTWQNLVSESAALQDQNADLAAQFRTLGEQILGLRNQLLLHTHCDDGSIAEYLTQTADKIVATAEQQYQHSKSCQTCVVTNAPAEMTTGFVAYTNDAYEDET
ncbi:hypothetical protein B0T21DRAFT_347860 [Apiosordaria backusii]|uniref:BZIP domain-containing protein n=1 Tax=Apiosordaria backusii TaxID=314023 RepID=A0AA40EDJ3_9PEZI|nr:hypothetical protein B0T21DRAFT_347860 [Apiosordaria backusii]